MEWLKANCNDLLVGLIVTIIGGIAVVSVTKCCSVFMQYFSKLNTNSKPKIEEEEEEEVNLTSDEKKLYSELIELTHRLISRITILSSLKQPQLGGEYSKVKIFLFNSIKNLNLKLDQSLEVSDKFKYDAKSFLNKMDTNFYKLASFMEMDIGRRNVNMLEIAQNLKNEIQEFQKALKK